ncbi:MAG: GTPase ObgE [Actinomycetota bacterium]|nr:GTPase ObgE [Actinomycetota bacterium]
MFLDEAKINVKAGNGGNGMTAFFKLKGGRKKVASGGKGGKGGDVIIQASSELSTLYGFKKKIHFKAKNGRNGEPNNRKGEDGSDLIIKVPEGTVLMDSSGRVIEDLDRAGKKILIAGGGIGGRGNASFVSSKRRFPAFAEKGEKTESFWINLELRLIADVSLVGFPNCGKSTIISRISAARPKIADYPFTTLIPNLGVVTVDEGNFVIADVPGFIKGAHKGSGLGDKFLKHVTRSGLLAVVLDGERIVDRREDIIETFNVLREEVRLYDRDLFKKDFVVLINKIDLISDNDKLNKIKSILENKSKKSVFLISAVTGEGLDRMVWSLYGKVKDLRESAGSVKEAEDKKAGRVRIYDSVKKVDDMGKIVVEKSGGEYILKNKKLERIVAMTDLENEEALGYLMYRFKKMGIADRLKKQGIKEGSTIIIGNLVFSLKD